MKQAHNILFPLLFVLSLILAGCGNSGNSLHGDYYGNPYTSIGAGLKGNVKTVKTYENRGRRQTLKAFTRYNYEGHIVKDVVYSGPDSATTRYAYDEDKRIMGVIKSDLDRYKPEFKYGKLVAETLKVKGGDGYTVKYKFNDDLQLDKKINTDLATGEEYNFVYKYYDNGNVKTLTLSFPSGKVKKTSYSEDGDTITESVDRKGTDNFRTTAVYILTNDSLGNWVEKHERGKRTFVTRVIEYYTDNEITASKPAKAETPSTTLLVIIAILSLISLIVYGKLADDNYELFHDFGGYVEDNGMKRMWMYNVEPYKKTVGIFLIILAAFLSAIVLLLAFGAAVWILFWLVKLLLWAIIILGWIMLVVGIILCICQLWPYGIPVGLIGLVIVYFKGTLKQWGEYIVAEGNEFFDSVNVIDWTVYIFTEYGKLMLLIAAAPLLFVLALSVLLIIVSLILRGVEFAAVKIYNINRPCPVCGNKDSFTYVIDGQDYPVPLHPGIYGIFHQTLYPGRKRIPTMLLNGKAKLTRRCDNCGSIINAKKQQVLGTDIHIGFVGERSSGKSYMLYSALSLIGQDPHWKECRQVDAGRNDKIEDMTDRIRHNEGIQTAVRNRYKAIQLLLKSSGRPVPYHVFFYDVAGEKFNVKNMNQQALEFYTNVRTIVFVLDPTMTDLSKSTASQSFADWQKEKIGDTEKYDPESTMAALLQVITHVGQKAKNINMIIACSKKDLGYLEATGHSDNPLEQDVRNFISYDMGLLNFVNIVEASFKSVGYIAVSVIDEYKASLEQLASRMLDKAGVNVK